MLYKRPRGSVRFRKSQGSAPGFLGYMVLIAAVVVLALFIMRGPAQAGQFTIGSALLKSNYDACKSKGERIATFTDIDKDKFPDDCDICLLRNGRGNDNDDLDVDSMPNACDSDSNDPSVFSCVKGPSWNKNLLALGRCVEK